MAARTLDPQGHVGFVTIAGSPEEVIRKLDKTKAKRVVVISFEHASQIMENYLSESLEKVLPLLEMKPNEDQIVSLAAKLQDDLLPAKPASSSMYREAAMLLKAKKAVLDEKQWLTASDISEMAGYSKINPSAQPAKWKKDRQIFSIRHQNVDYFPGFALDPKHDYKPLKAMSEVLKVFGDAKDGWGLAFWFMGLNSFLGGKKRPMDLLASEPERVVDAARLELQGVAHG